MGTTLTGTTPQDTYDSLIKVTDNGPLTGSLKKLTDGLGNDSSLSLSTTAASFSGSLTISGDTVGSKFYTAGSAVPTAAVSVFLNANYGGPAYNNSSFVTGNGATGVMMGGDTASYTYGWIQGVQTDNGNAKGLILQPISGNVGIGTSSPAHKLDVSGVIGGYQGGQTAYKTYTKAEGFQISAYQSVNGAPYTKTTDIVANADSGVASELRVLVAASGSNPAEVARFTPNGLTFNGDTAAANALDDYEEGTFTPTIIGSTTAGTATYGGGQEGKYTKIGNVVYFQIYLGYSGGTGTGDLRIAGLPFTVPSTDLPSFTFGVFLNVALTALNVPIAGGIGSTNQIYINQIPTGGGSQTSVPYDGSGVIQISGFYRV